MNTQFNKCYDFVKKWEGGYNDIKEDRGGATNYGISLNFLKDFIQKEKIFCENIGITKANIDTIKNLKESQAKSIYLENFYSPYCDDLALSIALCYFDMNVNHGVKNATRLMQKAYNATNPVIHLVTDGLYGAKTKKALAMETNLTCLIGHIYQERVNFYNAIVRNNPSQKVFINGWLKRARAMNDKARKYV